MFWPDVKEEMESLADLSLVFFVFPRRRTMSRSSTWLPGTKRVRHPASSSSSSSSPSADKETLGNCPCHARTSCWVYAQSDATAGLWLSSNVTWIIGFTLIVHRWLAPVAVETRDSRLCFACHIGSRTRSCVPDSAHLTWTVGSTDAHPQSLFSSTGGGQ